MEARPPRAAVSKRGQGGAPAPKTRAPQPRAHSGRPPKRSGWRTIAGIVFLGAMMAGVGAARVPAGIAAAYGALSVVAFLLYRSDKHAAQAGNRRTPERTLHLVDLLGGWPGALIAQDRFRHKTAKAAYQLVFWATVALNCAALAWLLGVGARLLQASPGTPI